MREERTEKENDIYDFTKNLLLLRKNHSSLRTGELIHFPPKNELYVYFRANNAEKILVVLNNSPRKMKLDLKAYSKIISDSFELVNLGTNNEVEIIGNMIEINPKSGNIFLIK